MSDPAQLLTAHRRCLRLVTDVVSGISADQLEQATPCSTWTLQQLLEHMVGQNHGFARAARGGGELRDWAPRPLGANPAAAWAESTTDVETAVAGLAGDGGLLMPEVRPAPLPAEVAISFHLLDTLVHGWDVAAASGQSFDCPDDLARLVLAVAARIPAAPGLRRPGAAFLLPAPPPPASAGAFHRALALLGRDPAWRRPGRIRPAQNIVNS